MGAQPRHASGRIHKDLKAENVMVDLPAAESPKGRANRKERLMDGGDAQSPASVKLIDFDTVEDWEPTSPKAKDVLGTDGYIAPEAYLGDYSPASDIYSIGVVMYKLLTGRFPSREDIFDDKPGENWVGSPAMKRIHERLKTEKLFRAQKCAALRCTGYEPNAQLLKPVLPCRGPDQVRCHLQCFEVFTWTKDTRMGTTKDTEDMTAETFGMMIDETYGKEDVEFFPMVAVMDYLKVELYYKVDMEGLYGKSWM
eukprot:s345_g17.t1